MTGPQPTSARSFYTQALLACALLFLLLYEIHLLLGLFPGHDQSWYLYGAQRLLAGDQLYGPHLTEVNPPLILWFNEIPAAFASLLHLSATTVMRVMVLALSFASALWSVSILRRQSWMTGWRVLTLMGFAIVASSFVIRLYNFGQREQLLMILVIPYILAAATSQARRLPWPEFCLLGLVAGIAICFKPQQWLIIAALEIFLALDRRSLRRAISPEFLLLIATIAAYVLIVLIGNPLYLKQVVPLLLDSYWALGNLKPMDIVLSHRSYALYLALVLLPICMIKRRSLRAPAIPIALLCCSLGASVAFAMQGAGWVYHGYPALACLFLAVSFLVLEAVHSRRATLEATPGPAARVLLTLVTLAAAFVGAYLLRDESRHQVYRNREKVEALLEPYAPGTTVYIFSTSNVLFSDVFLHKFRWGSRFAHLWMLPAIVQNKLGPIRPNSSFKKLNSEEMQLLESTQRTDTAQDLAYYRPTLILVDHCTQSHPCGGIEGKEFDILAWFLESPEFAAEWSHYQRQSSDPSVDVYTRLP